MGNISSVNDVIEFLHEWSEFGKFPIKFGDTTYVFYPVYAIYILIGLFALLFLVQILFWSGRRIKEWMRTYAVNRELRAHAQRVLRRRNRLEEIRLEIEEEKAKERRWYSKQRVRLERRFRGVSLWARISDTIVALMASTSPRSFLYHSFARFVDSIQHGGMTRASQLLIEKAERVRERRQTLVEWNNEFRKAKSVNDIDRQFFGEQILIYHKEAEALSEPDALETESLEKVEFWRRMLNRPAYADNFESILERQIKRWVKSRESLSDIDLDDETGERNLRSVRSRASQSWVWLLLISLWDWILGNGGLLNLLKFAPIFVVPAELFFAYPAFEALTDGNRIAAIAGTIVFVFGIYQVGEMFGIAVTRAQKRIPTSDESGRSAVVKRHRPLTWMAAGLLAFTAGWGIYAGTNIRAVTGEVLRKNQQVEVLNSEIRRVGGNIVKLEREGDSAGADLQRDSRDELARNRDAVIESRRALIQQSTYPTFDVEWFIAGFIYVVLFASAVGRRLFQRDPVFEYGVAQDAYLELKARRLEQLFAMRFGEFLSRILKWQVERRGAALEEELISARMREDALREEAQATVLEFKNLAEAIGLVVRDRARWFAGIVIWLRPRSTSDRVPAGNPLTIAEQMTEGVDRMVLRVSARTEGTEEQRLLEWDGQERVRT